MSTHHLAWALGLTADDSISPPQKLVLMILADGSDQEGVWNHGLEHLAKLCCMEKEPLRYGLHTLVDLGLIHTDVPTDHGMDVRIKILAPEEEGLTDIEPGEGGS